MKMHLIKTKNDSLYEVIHQIPEHIQMDVEKQRIKYQCTDVFRNNGQYWFVRLIEDAEVLEESLATQ